MADIAVVQMRLYLHEPETLDHNHVLHLLLQGDTPLYEVPVVFRADAHNRWLDLQYGEVEQPDLTALYETYAPIVESVWFRWLERFADFDQLCVSVDPAEAPLICGICTYQFDSIRVTWRDHATLNNFGFDWYKDGNVWTVSLNETYYAGNHRSRLTWDIAPTYDTPTSWVSGEPISDWLFGRWVNNKPIEEWRGMPRRLQTIGRVFSKWARQIEFFYRGRLVRVNVWDDDNDMWWELNLDDWDNCAAPEWLDYHLAVLEE